MNRLSRRLRLSAAALLFAVSPSFALNTTTVISSVASPDCLEYRVVGICYWLYCTWTGCTVRTSIKVRHYVPDAVVSSYSHTGENPWLEVRAMIEAHWDGIASCCRPENKVSLGMVEGLNNKIRGIKRTAYGYRDEEYLKLKIIASFLPTLPENSRFMYSA